MDLETEGERCENTDNKQRIHQMDLILITMALEIALQQIKIIEGCAASKTKFTADGDDQLRQAKLSRDRNLIKDIIRATRIELVEVGAWQSLYQAIDDLNKKTTEIIFLQQYQENLQRSITALRKELKSKRRQHFKEIQVLEEKITILADKKEDESLNAKYRLIYTEKWMNSLKEMQEIQQAVIRPALPSVDQETRVHQELCRAFQLQTQEKEKMVDEWRARYAQETASINVTVVEYYELLKKTTARRVELENLYNLHAGEINAWLTFKAERAARLAREQLATRSATSMQAWWRGLMVRRGLGAFKHLRNMKKTPTKSKKK